MRTLFDMKNKLLSFLGICRRARKLVIGAEAAAESVTGGKSRLVLYASDFSRGSLKKLRAAAEANGVEVLMLPVTKEVLSLALGRLSGALSVEDEGFAKKLREMIKSEQGGEFDENKG